MPLVDLPKAREMEVAVRLMLELDERQKHYFDTAPM
jgi:hypothetical protein